LQKLQKTPWNCHQFNDTHDFSPDAGAAWEEEICRRIEAVKAGTERSRSFEDVFADLDRRYPS